MTFVLQCSCSVEASSICYDCLHVTMMLAFITVFSNSFSPALVSVFVCLHRAGMKWIKKHISTWLTAWYRSKSPRTSPLSATFPVTGALASRFSKSKPVSASLSLTPEHYNYDFIYICFPNANLCSSMLVWKLSVLKSFTSFLSSFSSFNSSLHSHLTGLLHTVPQLLHNI